MILFAVKIFPSPSETLRNFGLGLIYEVFQIGSSSRIVPPAINLSTVKSWVSDDTALLAQRRRKHFPALISESEYTSLHVSLAQYAN